GDLHQRLLCLQRLRLLGMRLKERSLHTDLDFRCEDAKLFTKETLMPAVKISANRRVTIPKEIFEASGFREGQWVEVTRQNGVVVITEIDEALTAADRASLRRGLAQFKRGQSVPWEDVKKKLKL
ncbi:MAG: hypothetical protein RMJ90_05675, partial [Candidatus Bipolaricaulota bacterium]|nr:hypothetical protein [Candidatus Bipolaricaulota bacterium]